VTDEPREPDPEQRETEARETEQRSGLSRFQAFSFRVSDRLNRITKVYLGPAQVGTERPTTEVKPLTSSPCPLCGRPMAEHDLVRSDSERQRFYCPEPRD
jgi:hypothetical protein